MATVTFDGTTIWNDAATGVGRVVVFEQLAFQRKSFNFVPAYGGYITKLLGSEPGRIVLVLDYWLNDSEKESLISTVAGKADDTGTLVYLTIDGTRSVNNCTLAAAPDLTRRDIQLRLPSGILKEWNTLVLQFQKVS